MFKSSPAVEWLETSPESPYNLERTRLRRYVGGGAFWEVPYEVYQASPLDMLSVQIQPMIRLKDD
jgi:hypothetical protein